MRPDDFELMRDLLKRRSGLVVSPDKIYLLESRLTPLARRMGLEGLDELVQRIRDDRDEELVKEVTEAMTTNESFFFRDKTPFDTLQQLMLPQLHQSRADKKKIRIWCTACSSGQEPYSISMIFKESPEKWEGWNIEILATDLSEKILEKARKGLYSQFEVQRGLPVQMLIKYFTQSGEMWQISEEVRNSVEFKPLNLLEPFQGLGTFDVIFCRNVLIYFESETKADVLNRISELMNRDASLFIGTAETVLGISTKFKPVRGERGIYLLSSGEGDSLLATG